MRHGLGIAALTATALVTTLAGGCSMYRNDRCWMDQEQYLVARDLFVQTGSIDLVERDLRSYEWAPCKVNEALYRLQKEFEVLPEAPLGAPAAVAPAEPQATPATTPTTKP